ncbi:hypothetical protein NUW58_g5735 [Xylaria curta]|uniref:Uncharacterized protein n=1 Tax=Xylaria curta TaxID=42375 RepID=A0ACC1P063_9PEZI|nr:hypothetical protein NUW58_g5735 [Xylaria curta]
MCPGPSYPGGGRWSRLTPLEGCDWITDLAFEWMGIRKGFQTFPDSGTSGFRRICKSLRRLPALKNLWIISSGPVVGDASVFAAMSAKARKSLRYVRIGSSAWRIRRDWNSDAVVLEALDAWEDEVEGPEFFHVPAPLPNYYQYLIENLGCVTGEKTKTGLHARQRNLYTLEKELGSYLLMARRPTDHFRGEPIEIYVEGFGIGEEAAIDTRRQARPEPTQQSVEAGLSGSGEDSNVAAKIYRELQA